MMTIVLDPDDKKLYALFWGDDDNFSKLQHREITMDEAKEYCIAGHDYITIRRLDEAVKEVSSWK